MLDFTVTFAITIINITILFLFLRKFLFKPVTKFMADRALRIQAAISQADKDKAEARRMLADYESRIKNAEAEAQEILKTARADANGEAARIIAEGKTAAENIVENARKNIEAERQAVMAKFKIEAAALVMAATAKLAARDISGDDNRRYANMLLDELAAKKG